MSSTPNCYTWETRQERIPRVDEEEAAAEYFRQHGATGFSVSVRAGKACESDCGICRSLREPGTE